MTLSPPRQAVLIVPPANEPLTLAEVKLFLRVDGSEEDSLITQLSLTARQLAEKYLRKVLILQTWQMRQIYVAGQSVCLTPAPVIAISEVIKVQNDTETTLSTSDYKLELTGDKLSLMDAGQVDSVKITFTAGYGGAAQDVPAPIRQGLLHCISYLYHHREEAADICKQAKSLWEPYKEWSL